MSAQPSPSRTRPLYWSIRRELWENRSLTRAPLAAAAIVLLGFLISTLHLPAQLQALTTDPAGAARALLIPYRLTAILQMALAVIIGVFYCLDALYGERRDRSILFWKSLPVSDGTAVLAKAAIPLLLLPAMAFATTIAIQIVMLLCATIAALLHGLAASSLWNTVALVPMAIELLYGLVTLTLWYAPLYAWLLLVSAWARRTPLLWAILPPLGLCVLERVAFGTWHLATLLAHRLTGSIATAFDTDAAPYGSAGQLTRMNPARFLASPDLWIGLAVAALLLAATIRLRRHRGPI